MTAPTMEQMLGAVIAASDEIQRAKAVGEGSASLVGLMSHYSQARSDLLTRFAELERERDGAIRQRDIERAENRQFAEANKDLIIELSAVTRKLYAYRADAERHQHIRGRIGWDALWDGPFFATGNGKIDPEETDRAIDAAIAQRAGETG